MAFLVFLEFVYCPCLFLFYSLRSMLGVPLENYLYILVTG